MVPVDLPLALPGDVAAATAHGSTAGGVLRCAYHAAGVCGSCTWLGRPYDEQLARLDADCREVLAAALGTRAHGIEWSPPVASPPAAFRAKAKMVVGGTVAAPTLGILDRTGNGTDLRACALLTPGLQAAMPVLADLVTQARLTPYDVPARRGELKHLIVVEAPDGGLMVRAVLRSTEGLPRLRARLGWLRERLPRLVVLSANLQPVHAAVLEGPEEVVLSEEATLPVAVGDVTLHLRPQGFVQTNLAVAGTLYRQARAWAERALPAAAGGRVWDLYCGAGGFALHLAGGRRHVVGVEVAAESVAAAERSRDELGAPADGPGGVRFVAADATRWAQEQPAAAAPDLVVVNPPRRGLGPDLAGRLEAADGARYVLYSSCDVTSLARDLAAMPSWRPVAAQVLDMFPQTRHAEVLVLLSR
ncbi:methyltransferase domain-containing protein [Aquipuribacter nitratireducens]|uniref:Methyltransferase domain-containing protein n=1 Tax=Aquipuribacter nitratireducens TaxID=650104 RepID=A0ABW0GSN6_9MICO